MRSETEVKNTLDTLRKEYERESKEYQNGVRLYDSMTDEGRKRHLNQKDRVEQLYRAIIGLEWVLELRD